MRYEYHSHRYTYHHDHYPPAIKYGGSLGDTHCHWYLNGKNINGELSSKPNLSTSIRVELNACYYTSCSYENSILINFIGSLSSPMKFPVSISTLWSPDGWNPNHLWSFLGWWALRQLALTPSCLGMSIGDWAVLLSGYTAGKLAKQIL